MDSSSGVLLREPAPEVNLQRRQIQSAQLNKASSLLPFVFSNQLHIAFHPEHGIPPFHNFFGESFLPIPCGRTSIIRAKHE